MSANPQTQSSFVNRLPREIRNAIYLELWRSCGLRQYIVWHGSEADQHFCRWQCATEYNVQDELQRDLEELRVLLQVPLGRNIEKGQSEKQVLYCRRLQSPWMNHWPCGELAYEKHGLGAVWGATTSMIKCWRKKERSDREGLGQALKSLCCFRANSCKWLSCIYYSLKNANALQLRGMPAIYLWVDDVHLHDFRALQMFFGYCKLHQDMRKLSKIGITPPSFLPVHPKLGVVVQSGFPYPSIMHKLWSSWDRAPAWNLWLSLVAARSVPKSR